MKTTLTEKLDNYLESTHGTITLLATIGVVIGGLFALSLAHDYGVTTPTAFGMVLFLVGFGVVLGGLGAYIVAEKVGYANSAQVSRSLHKHYNGEIEKVQAELASVTNGYRSLNTENADSARAIQQLRDENRALVASLANARERLARSGSDLVEHEQADKYADTLHTLTNAVYHFGWALIEDGDLFESAKFRLLALHCEPLTDTAKAQAFREYVLDIYADDDIESVYLGEKFLPSA